MAGTNEKLQIKKIGFGEAIKSYFSNLFNFNGRATRSEFWWVIPFYLLICILQIVFFHRDINDPLARFADPKIRLHLFFYRLIIVVAIAFIVFSFGIGTRRMHDRNSFGLFVFFSGVSNLIAEIVLFVQTFLIPKFPFPEGEWSVGDYQDWMKLWKMSDVGKIDNALGIVGIIALLIGILATIILLILALKPSSPANKYGEPKIEQ